MELDRKDIKRYILIAKAIDADICDYDNYDIEQAFARNQKRITAYSWKQKYLNNALRIAAILLLPFILSTGFLSYLYINRLQEDKHISYLEVVSAPGIVTQMELPDKSKVWLNAGSSLRYPSRFTGDERTVYLSGEGYFEVAHNEKHPFIVETEKYDIRVLGTTFNVSAYPNSGLFEASLIEGKVTVYHPETQNEIILNPHEKVEVRDGKLYKETFTSDHDFLWRMGIYSFKDEPLETVFKKLEQYYEVKIINKNIEITSHPCTGKFRQKEGIEHVMRVLQKYIKFNYIQDDEKNQIIIY